VARLSVQERVEILRLHKQALPIQQLDPCQGKLAEGGQESPGRTC